MIVVLLILGAGVLLERPNFGDWSPPERMVFWVLWGLALAWVGAVALHLPTPNLIQLQDHAFGHLARRWLTAKRDPFW